MNNAPAGGSHPLLEMLPGLEVDALGVVPVSQISDARLRDQVVKLLPGARSAVALAGEVFAEIVDHSSPTKTMGEGSPRDMLPPHQDYVNGRLTKSAYDVAKALRRQGFKTLPMPAANYPTDQRYLTSILSYKHVALAAGVGSLGWHSLLVTPQFGARVRLACILTEAELPATPGVADSLCDGCGECLRACPVGALSQPKNADPYSMNKYACSVFRTGAGPCSECMRVCPAGR